MSALLKLVPTWCWALVAGLALCGLQQIRVVGLEGDLAAASSLERESDPECVKTLSYRACFSPLLLDVVISRLFTTISAGNASERV